jgi:DHA1 family bicyclomycin/chloramphenicol resistance-like MFS transporter
MSRSNFTSMQQNNQEAVLNSAIEGTEQMEIESKDTSTRIRARHVLILGGLSAFGPLSTDMYLPSLPALSHDLSATVSQAQMTLSAGILGLALGQIIAGPISDALGRRRPLLIGIIAFVLASLLCIVAPSITILTILRFIQGTAGAAGIVIALAIVRDLYSGNAMARFLSLLMLVNGLAPIVAPIIGSQLLRFTSWHGVFVTLALIGAVLLSASAFGLGETLPTTRRQSGGISATFGAFRDLITDRRFMGYAISSGFAFAACIIYISVSPFILQNIYGLSPQIFGLLFGINALGIVIVGQINGRLVGRVSSLRLLTWGIVGIALGSTSLLVVILSDIGLVGVLPSLFVLVSSLGFIMPNAATLALSTTRTAGSASALLGVLQLVIGPIAAPLVGLGGTTSAVPMAIGIAAFGVATLLTFIVFCRPTTIRQGPQRVETI